jgi:hypothetical protein
MKLLQLVGCRSLAILTFSCLLLATGGLRATAENTAGPPPGPTSVEGDILKIDGDTLTVAVPQNYKITGDNPDQKLGTLSIGDTVRLAADNDNVAQAKDVSKDNKSLRVSVLGRLLAGFIAFAFVFLIAALATGRSNNGKPAFGNPLSFCVGIDNRTSNSQTQMVFWSATVLVVYLTTVFLRGWMTDWSLLGGVGIPVNLLAFSGLSALSFGGARAITVSKTNAAAADNLIGVADVSAIGDTAGKDAQAKAAAAAAAVETAQAAPNNSGAVAAGAAIDAAEEAARVADVTQVVAVQTAAQPTDADVKTSAPAGTAHITQLFQNDTGRADLGDTQMILITLIAIATYLVTSFHQLGNLEIAQQVSLPDIDSYLLASFGIGQGAYLAKKAASNPSSG